MWLNKNTSRDSMADTKRDRWGERYFNKLILIHWLSKTWCDLLLVRVHGVPVHPQTPCREPHKHQGIVAQRKKLYWGDQVLFIGQKFKREEDNPLSPVPLFYIIKDLSSTKLRTKSWVVLVRNSWLLLNWSRRKMFQENEVWFPAHTSSEYKSPGVNDMSNLWAEIW